MRVSFDTSVLVPALVRSHPFHERAIVWLEAAVDGALSGLASWHAIAETWSVLTRLPLQPVLSGQQAWEVVSRIRKHLELIPPGSEIYELAVIRCAQRRRSSGAVFDAIHLLTAERSQADLLLTFNPEDFHSLRTQTGPRIVTPPTPPGLDIPDPTED